MVNKENDFSKAKVGDVVYSLVYGKGEIIEKHKDYERSKATTPDYPITAIFGEVKLTFTNSGKNLTCQAYPDLYRVPVQVAVNEIDVEKLDKPILKPFDKIFFKTPFNNDWALGFYAC